MKKLKYAVILLLALTLSSCVDSGINIFDADYTVQILGEDLVIPIGTTKPLTLADLLKDTNVESDSDGNLFMRTGGSKTITDNFLSFQDVSRMKFDNGEKHLTYTLSPIQGFSSTTHPQFANTLIFAFEDEKLEFSAPVDQDLIKYIDILDKLLFDGGDVGLKLKMLSSCGLPASQVIDFVIDFAFSDFFIFDDPRVDENNHLRLEGSISCDPSKPFVLGERVNLVGFDFNGTKPVNVIKEYVALKGTISIDVSSLSASQISMLSGGSLSVLLTADADELVLRDAYGTLNYQMPDPVKEYIAFPEIPEILKGDNAVLDLNHQAVNLTVTSNVTVPVRAELTITPQYGLTPDASHAVTFVLDLPEALFTDKDTTRVTRLCLCDRGSKYSSTNESTVLYPVSGSLHDFMQKIPDSILLTCDAEIIKRDVLGERLVHVMDLQQTPSISLDYNFIIPLSAGPDFHVSLSTDLKFGENSTLNLVEILSSSEVGIVGEVNSSLPLDMILTVIPLDENMKEIVSGTSVASQKINAYNLLDGEFTTTKLDIRMGGNGFAQGVSSISALRLKFTFAHPQTNGEAVLNKDASISASIGLLLPQGIVIKQKNIN